MSEEKTEKKMIIELHVNNYSKAAKTLSYLFFIHCFAQTLVKSQATAGLTIETETRTQTWEQ